MNYFKKILRYLFISLSLVVFLVFCLLLIIKLFFPAHELKRIAEEKLEEVLKQQVNVGMVQFNPLRGIELKNILIGEKELQLLSIKKLSFEYDLRQLLKRKFIINRISIVKPTINVNYKQNKWDIPLIKSDDRPKDEIKSKVIKKTKKFASPFLPFDIDVDEFNITDLSLSVNYNNIILKSSGINLLLKGKLSPSSFNLEGLITSSSESAFLFQQLSPQNITFNSFYDVRLNIKLQELNNISISGSLKLKKLSAFYKNPIDLDRFTVAFDMLLNIVDEKINVKTIDVAADDFFNLKVTGVVDQIMNRPELDLTLKELTVNLKKINSYISAFIPNLNVEGELGANNLQIAGSLQSENRLNATVQGLIYFKNVSGEYFKTNYSIKKAEGSIKLIKLDLKNSLPDKIDAKIHFHLNNLATKTIAVNGLNQDIHFFTSKKVPDEQRIKFNTKLDKMELSIEKRPPVVFPFNAHGSAVLNIASLDIKRLHTEWKLSEAASGIVTAAFLKSDDNRFTMNSILSLDIQKVKEYIPVVYLQKLKGLNLSGNISSDINLDGKLNNQYLPENIKFEMSSKLENVNINYPLYQTVLSGLNVDYFARGKYDEKKGIELPEFKMKGNVLKIKYVDQLNIEQSEFSLKAENKGLLSLKKPSGMNINITGTVKNRLAELIPSQTKLNQFLMNFAFSAVTSGEKKLENIKLSSDLITRNLQVGNRIFSDNVKVAIDLSSPYLTFNKPRANLNLSVDGIRIQDKNWVSPRNNFTAQFLLVPDLQKKSVAIKNVEINSQSLFRISLQDGMFDAGKKFNIHDLNISLDVKKLLNNVPPDFQNKIPVQNPSGRIHISTNASGKIPTIMDINKLRIPVTFTSKLSIDKMSLGVKSLNYKIRNLNSRSKINFNTNAINLSGTTSIDSVAIGVQPTIPELSDINYQYDYALKNFNSLNINRSTLTIENKAVFYSLDGVIKGFNFMLSGGVPFNVRDLLERIELELHSKLSINGGNMPSWDFPVKFAGQFHSNFFIKLIPEEILSLDGNIRFNDFILKSDENFIIKNINGSIPIKKSYSFITGNKIKLLLSSLKPLDKFIPQSGLFSNLRSYSKHRDLFSIRQIKAGNQTINNIYMDIYLKDNLFAAEQFSMELKGGTVLGNIYFIPDSRGHKLSLKANFSNIDLRKVFEISSKGKEKIDSRINGNVEFVIAVSNEKESTGFMLEQIEIDFNITHIGDKALDQLLLFLDPAESNPSIANLKDKLKLAKPSRINVRLKNERLSMFVQLKTSLTKSGFLDIQVLNGIPVQRLKQFSLITKNIKNISQILNVFSKWSSTYTVLNKK